MNIYKNKDEETGCFFLERFADVFTMTVTHITPCSIEFQGLLPSIYFTKNYKIYIQSPKNYYQEILRISRSIRIHSPPPKY